MSISSRRPNFIFILADDLGYADLGCAGARDAQGRPALTPNLDRTGAEGLCSRMAMRTLRSARRRVSR